jgi:taurine dioxygenase
MADPKGNCVVEFQHIAVAPMHGAFGAEVSGFDASAPIEAAVAAELNRAFADFKLLVFRDAVTSIERHKHLARVFGEAQIHPLFDAIPGHPEVIQIMKDVDDKVNFGGAWHADMTCLEDPPAASVLRILEAPPVGGDTMFSDMCAAYDAVSAPMKSMLDGLQAIHTSAKVYGPAGKYAQSNAKNAAAVHMDGMVSSTHPVIRTHPRTGRKGIFVNRANSIFIRGLNLEESSMILEFLYQHAVRGEFTTRVNWKNDTTTIWDNRCLQHYALNDYHGYRRVAQRINIQGDKPF